ncbi:hypothetical protein [Lysobacter silvisoli]|nr:hypothetical protein [Lysobacter silvisoli]
MARIPPRRTPTLVVVSMAVFGLLAGTPAFAAVQSDAVSRQSEASLNASVEVPVAVSLALSEGAKFSVTAVGASAQGVAVTVSAVGVGASFVVYLSAEAAKELGLRAGQAVVVSAVAAGWLLSVDGHKLCFVPNERARSLLHSRPIG